MFARRVAKLASLWLPAWIQNSGIIRAIAN